MKRVIIITIGIIAMLGAFHNIEAQDANEQMWLKWYLDYRFDHADANKDGEINFKEVIGAKDSAFDFYREQSVFDQADRNNNNRLSKLELKAFMKAEELYMKKMDIQDMASISNEYKESKLKDIDYLKKKPEIVSRLLSNTYWIGENSTMYKNLLNNEDWILKNSKVLKSLNENKRNFVMNPELSSDFFSRALLVEDTEFMNLYSGFTRIMEMRASMNSSKDITAGKKKVKKKTSRSKRNRGN